MVTYRYIVLCNVRYVQPYSVYIISTYHRNRKRVKKKRTSVRKYWTQYNVHFMTIMTRENPCRIHLQTYNVPSFHIWKFDTRADVGTSMRANVPQVSLITQCGARADEMNLVCSSQLQNGYDFLHRMAGKVFCLLCHFTVRFTMHPA